MVQDGLLAFFIKGCAFPLAFNLSIKTIKFPDKWKLSKICPIHKKDNNTDVKYRPITIINNLGKILEFVLHNALYPQRKHSICINQHGIIPKRSTISNLICITQHLAENMDEGNQVDVMYGYIDFTKAFDCLDHGVLLTKLCSFGFRKKLAIFFK